MQNSGTKLVLGLVSIALLLGVVSWWYRYEAAHRTSQFWGPEASRLIAESEGFEVWEFDTEPLAGSSRLPTTTTVAPRDLSRARGQAHLRHALMSDRNYIWDKPLDADGIHWRWHLRFKEDWKQATVLLSEDLKAVGKFDTSARTDLPGSPGLLSDPIEAYSCQPMTESLTVYFKALGILDKEAASTAAE